MSEAKHKRVTWAVDVDDGHWNVYQIGGGLVAAAYTEANALFIASAPDLAAQNARLLEVVQLLDKHWTTDFPGGPETKLAFGKFSDETLEIWRKARAALASVGGA